MHLPGRSVPVQQCWRWGIGSTEWACACTWCTSAESRIGCRMLYMVACPHYVRACVRTYSAVAGRLAAATAACSTCMLACLVHACLAGLRSRSARSMNACLCLSILNATATTMLGLSQAQVPGFFLPAGSSLLVWFWTTLAPRKR